jgi:hypothetical protein
MTQMNKPGYILAQGLPGLWLTSISHRQKFFLFLFKSLEVHNDCTLRTTKVLKAVVLGRTDKHKEKSK